MATQPSDAPPPEGKPQSQTTAGRGIKGDLGDLLNNFFQEGISRIVPGLVVLALYAHKPIIAAYNKFYDSSTIFPFGIVVAAWLIGVALDIFVYIPLIFWKSLTGKDAPQDPEPGVGKYDNPTGVVVDETARLRFLKDQAEKVMFRSITIIATFTVFVKPGLLEVIPKSEYPELESWQMQISKFIVFLFGVAFWWVKFGNHRPALWWKRNGILFAILFGEAICWVGFKNSLPILWRIIIILIVLLGLFWWAKFGNKKFIYRD
jgi:hypothetical protein